jgi:hypothetical protein
MRCPREPRQRHGGEPDETPTLPGGERGTLASKGVASLTGIQSLALKQQPGWHRVREDAGSCCHDDDWARRDPIGVCSGSRAPNAYPLDTSSTFIVVLIEDDFLSIREDGSAVITNRGRGARGWLRAHYGGK